jgi:hypothetical protein
VERQFVENLPLNGRSFQSLLYVTPGVDLNVGAGPTNTNVPQAQGQFVVNGQRGDANYWMVDGVSGNVGMNGFASGNMVSGAIGATNAMGGTSALVSVDAMQEFRIESSSYAPEFGRQPGAQISILTRSGTNQWHGTAFDYFRNTALDAKDWFANAAGLPQAAEHQNDFGGVLGGPITRDKSFFFFSYEGLRVRLPATFLGMVPNLATRQSALPAMQPYMNTYPLPSPAGVGIPAGVEIPQGLAAYSATFSNASTADAYSLRLDHTLSKNVILFARYSHAPSSSDQRGVDGFAANTVFTNRAVTKTATVGATWTKSAQTVNEMRFNYSVSGGETRVVSDTFGGGMPFPGASLFLSPYSAANSLFEVLPIFGTNMFEGTGLNGRNFQHQYNTFDTLSMQKGEHSLKFGVDYRRLSPSINFDEQQVAAFFTDLTSVRIGATNPTLNFAYPPVTFLGHNLGVFAQDTWRLSTRLNLTYGLRWDVDFTPTAQSGPSPAAVTGFSLTDLSNLALAPSGTKPYATRYGNVAPRVGGAYRISTNAKWGQVLRGGFGVFYGLASTEMGNAVLDGYPYLAIKAIPNAPFPTTPADAAVPSVIPPDASQGTLFGFDPNLKPPYALEWNVVLEQSLGTRQTFALSYIGASDSRLLATASISNPNPKYASAVLVSNAGSSSYEGLQLQFQRRLSSGLQALGSYTWAHSIDNGSYGAYANGGFASANTNRGPSDFDLRHVFTAALTYYIPALRKNAITHAITDGWSTDNVLQIRTGPPIDVQDANFTALSHENTSILIRPDVVPGQPLYLYGSQYPGGKALNPNAFADPPVDPTTGSPTRQGTLGRNRLRALGLTQWDFGIHRDFPIHESLKLQFRAELFNILNHPNFGPFNNAFQTGNGYFGQATQMLNQYLGGLAGSGTQNPLYAPGGPRSGSLALKLIF